MNNAIHKTKRTLRRMALNEVGCVTSLFVCRLDLCANIRQHCPIRHMLGPLYVCTPLHITPLPTTTTITSSSSAPCMQQPLRISDCTAARERNRTARIDTGNYQRSGAGTTRHRKSTPCGDRRGGTSSRRQACVRACPCTDDCSFVCIVIESNAAPQSSRIGSSRVESIAAWNSTGSGVIRYCYLYGFRWGQPVRPARPGAGRRIMLAGSEAAWPQRAYIATSFDARSRGRRLDYCRGGGDPRLITFRRSTSSACARRDGVDMTFFALGVRRRWRERWCHHYYIGPPYIGVELDGVGRDNWRSDSAVSGWMHVAWRWQPRRNDRPPSIQIYYCECFRHRSCPKGKSSLRPPGRPADLSTECPVGDGGFVFLYMRSSRAVPVAPARNLYTNNMTWYCPDAQTIIRYIVNDGTGMR